MGVVVGGVVVGVVVGGVVVGGVVVGGVVVGGVVVGGVVVGVSSSKSENSTSTSPGCRSGSVTTGRVSGFRSPVSGVCLRQPARAASKQTAKIILIQTLIDHFLIGRQPHPAPWQRIRCNRCNAGYRYNCYNRLWSTHWHPHSGCKNGQQSRWHKLPPAHLLQGFYR